MRLVTSAFILIMATAALLLMSLRHANAQVFAQVYPDFPANEMTDLVHWNGDTLFACGFNWTLQRSTDAGATWEEMLHGYPKYNLVRMGSDGNYLYLLPVPTGFTQDEMKNDPRVLILRYNPRTGDMSSVYVDRIPASQPFFPQVEMAVGHSVVALFQAYRDSTRLDVSTDAGMNWTELRLPEDYYENEQSFLGQFSFRDPMVGMISIKTDPVIGAGFNVYTTHDGGQTWTEVESVQQQFVTYARTPPEPGGWFGDSLAVLIHERQTPVISTDSGQSWTWYAPVNKRIEAISFDERGNGYLADETEGIWKTTDFGTSWVSCRPGIERAYQDETLGCIAQFGADTLVTLDVYGNIQRTTDGGVSWDEIRMSRLWSFTDLQFVTPDLGYVRAIDVLDGHRRFLRTTDGGVTWNDYGDFPVSGQFPQFYYLDEQHAFAVRNHLYSQRSDSLIFRSTDGGGHWQPVYFWSEADSIDINIVLHGHWFCSPDTGYAPVMGNRLLRTTDMGDTWELLPGPSTLVGRENIRWFEARYSPVLWMMTDSLLLRSRDAGVSWTTALELPDSLPGWLRFRELAILPDRSVQVATDRNVFHSTDNGTTWEHWQAFPAMRHEQYSRLEGVGSNGGQNFYNYGGQVNIFSTKDGWRTRHLEWSYGYGRINNAMLYFLDRMHGWMYGLTGIYRTTNGGINWTNVTPSIPQSPRILSTWPQPVTRGGMMSTEVELTRPGPVRIELYDLLGRRRAVVWDAEVTATRRTVQWSTAGLERGVYILRMVTGSDVVTSKVVVE